jgi:predicted Fe-S protein YdhL (DUF1289 family)
LLEQRRIATLAPMTAPPKPVSSPCTLVCVMNPATGLCYGCHRTIEEIAAWSLYSDSERAVITADLKERAKSAG